MELADAVLELTLEGFSIEFQDDLESEALLIIMTKGDLQRVLKVDRVLLEYSKHWLSERLGKTLEIMAYEIRDTLGV